MKLILLTGTLLISLGVFAVERNLSFKKDRDGHLHFGVVYTYDVKSTFGFTYTTDLSANDISNLPDSILWKIVDMEKNANISDWYSANKRNLIVGSLQSSDKIVLAKLLPRLRFAKIVFGVPNPQVNGEVVSLYSISIGPYCQSHPTYFADLTNFQKPACTVTKNDFPKIEDECKKLEMKSLKYLNEGLLPCSAVQKDYKQKGCGDWKCR